jgi:two-component system LytT family sensor kinase
MNDDHAAAARGRPFGLGARTIGLIFLGWTIYALLLANMLYWIRQVNPDMPQVSYVNLLRWALPEAWLWAILTLPIIEAARRLPVTAANWWHRVPTHFLIAVALHVVFATVMYFAHPYVRPGGPRPPWPRNLVSGYFFVWFIYAAIVATWHAVHAQGQALRFKNALLEAELRTLRMQLQPHFLFNTLNAVSELIHRDPARAERAVARLGDLLRWSLSSSSLREVSLREELAALDLYLDIQRLRYGDDLSLTVEAESAALEVAVPSLLLQPLVENAIRHGVHGARGAVAVDARRENGRLLLRVADDGRGLSPDFREGTGLRATRARLAGLYGDDHALRFTGGPDGGTTVEVTIPARTILAEGAIG